MRALAILGLLALVQRALPAQTTAKWFRGNTHTHTLESDGDSPPDSVARWYRDHGYHFLFITDHEKVTDPAPIAERLGARGTFILIPGQEVTQAHADSTHPEGRRQAHINSLGAMRRVDRTGDHRGATGLTMRDGYARNVAAIRAAGGVAQVNHPNWRWSVRLEDMAALPDSTLFELWNAHVGVNNAGGRDASGAVALSTEALWDSLLTRGVLLFGVADDDSHSFRAGGADESALTRPGRAWIVARADTLTAPAIVSALRRGDFYASTGVTLATLEMAGPVVSLSMQRGRGDDRRYTTEFIGRGGRVLATAHGDSASYRVRGDEGYVRVRVTDSNGRRAWTQPRLVR